MEPSKSIVGVDMNDPQTLSLYNQVYLFQNDLTREDISFNDQSNMEQGILHSIADALALDYEYSKATRRVRISRNIPSEEPMSTAPGFLDLLKDFNFNDADLSQGFFDENLNGYSQGDVRTSIPAGGPDINTFLYDEQLLERMDVDPNYFSQPEFRFEGGSLQEATQGGILQSPTNDACLDTASPEQAIARGSAQTAQVVHGAVTSTKRKASERSESPIDGCGTLNVSEFNIPITSIASWVQEIEQAPLGISAGQVDTPPILSDSQSSPPAALSPQPVFSGPASTSSLQSESVSKRPKKMFRRSSSVNSGASSGYKEIIFDSKSAHSESATSELSGRSGTSRRHGPLGEIARAGMRALKKVGACWRCKILRKTCNPDDPCSLCPRKEFLVRKKEYSRWEAVGCQRGYLKDRMLPIRMCPRSYPRNLVALNIRYEAPGRPPMNPNTLLEGYITRRAECLQNHQRLVLGESSDSEIYRRHFLAFNEKGSMGVDENTLSPLDECVLDVIWNLLNPASRRSKYGPHPLLDYDKRAPYKVTELLISASTYQASLESDKLIALSLMCLRSCLDAVYIADSCVLDDSRHQDCGPTRCEIQCLSTLEEHIGLYLDELHRVFFKKENLYSKTNWWLSVFYSLCIQDLVKEGLQRLARSSRTVPMIIACRNYLDLAIGLFIAHSGGYDPLSDQHQRILNLSSTADDRMSKLEEQHQKARVVVDLDGQTSGDYLKTLFHGFSDEISQSIPDISKRQYPDYLDETLASSSVEVVKNGEPCNEYETGNLTFSEKRERHRALKDLWQFRTSYLLNYQDESGLPKQAQNQNPRDGASPSRLQQYVMSQTQSRAQERPDSIGGYSGSRASSFSSFDDSLVAESPFEDAQDPFDGLAARGNR